MLYLHISLLNLGVLLKHDMKMKKSNQKKKKKGKRKKKDHVNWSTTATTPLYLYVNYSTQLGRIPT